MIRQDYKEMINQASVIRELFTYATERGKEIGYENVFDYSLGNPSVPAPKEFTDAMIEMLQTENPVTLHGYSPTPGIPSVRAAIAESLNKRFGMNYTANHIFMATGAAGAVAHAVRCVTKPGDEVLTFAPFFPAMPMNTVPTGVSRVPPSGPASPVADTPQSAPLIFLTPAAISSAHRALTTPTVSTVSARTPRMRTLEAAA